MASKREQILAAITTKLKAAPPIAATIERSRLVSLARTDGLSIWVEPVQDSSDPSQVPMLDWVLVVRVGIVARGLVPDQVADPAVAAAHARIMADLTLGGLCYDIQPRSSTWQLIDADAGACVVICEFAVLYRTTLQSIEA